MGFEQYPEPPIRAEGTDGNENVKSKDGKLEITDQSVEGLLYHISEQLDVLIELIKGVVG
jgi:hypothetical protein